MLIEIKFPTYVCILAESNVLYSSADVRHPWRIYNRKRFHSNLWRWQGEFNRVWRDLKSMSGPFLHPRPHLISRAPQHLKPEINKFEFTITNVDWLAKTENSLLQKRFETFDRVGMPQTSMEKSRDRFRASNGRQDKHGSCSCSRFLPDVKD